MLPDLKNLKITLLCMLGVKQGGVNSKAKIRPESIRDKEKNEKKKCIQNLQEFSSETATKVIFLRVSSWFWAGNYWKELKIALEKK